MVLLHVNYNWKAVANQEPSNPAGTSVWSQGGGGGEILGKILVGVCQWDSDTLNLNQTTFRSFLQPYSRLDAKNPYPIPD